MLRCKVLKDDSMDGLACDNPKRFRASWQTLFCRPHWQFYCGLSKSKSNDSQSTTTSPVYLNNHKRHDGYVDLVLSFTLWQGACCLSIIPREMHDRYMQWAILANVGNFVQVSILIAITSAAPIAKRPRVTMSISSSWWSCTASLLVSDTKADSRSIWIAAFAYLLPRNNDV